jgi:hypothetical protein
MTTYQFVDETSLSKKTTLRTSDEMWNKMTNNEADLPRQMSPIEDLLCSYETELEIPIESLSKHVWTSRQAKEHHAVKEETRPETVDGSQED